MKKPRAPAHEPAVAGRLGVAAADAAWYGGTVNREAIRAFVERDRASVARLKQMHWADEIETRGSDVTLRASRALWAYVRSARPDWPTPSDRADDLQHHCELKRALDAAADAFARR